MLGKASFCREITAWCSRGIKLQETTARETQVPPVRMKTKPCALDFYCSCSESLRIQQGNTTHLPSQSDGQKAEGHRLQGPASQHLQGFIPFLRLCKRISLLALPAVQVRLIPGRMDLSSICNHCGYQQVSCPKAAICTRNKNPDSSGQSRIIPCFLD
jgi:hypothetical protein